MTSSGYRDSRLDGVLGVIHRQVLELTGLNFQNSEFSQSIDFTSVGGKEWGLDKPAHSVHLEKRHFGLNKIVKG